MSWQTPSFLFRKLLSLIFETFRLPAENNEAFIFVGSNPVFFSDSTYVTVFLLNFFKHYSNMQGLENLAAHNICKKLLLFVFSLNFFPNKIYYCISYPLGQSFLFFSLNQNLFFLNKTWENLHQSLFSNICLYFRLNKHNFLPLWFLCIMFTFFDFDTFCEVDRKLFSSEVPSPSYICTYVIFFAFRWS